MKPDIWIGLCLVLAFVEVNADVDNELSRGLYPFMAFIYYPDETVVDSTGNRFIRGAVLIKNEWLVSSAIGPNLHNGFPRKTLIARAGAVTIDSNFTLNEDEYEQEREVIQIVRPYNHSATQWWRTDISLMKTLLPFNITTAVVTATLNPKHDNNEKSCIILVYIRRFGNWTEDKLLMPMSVDLLPPTIINCGNHFVGNTMTCAADSDDTTSNPNFCQGNSGGPLICDGDVIGLQTYIDNDCKQPHLYQLLTAWENFISCGTEEKCQERDCAYICDIANKDVPITEAVTAVEEITMTSADTIATTTTKAPITPTVTKDDAIIITSTTLELSRSDQLVVLTSAKPMFKITNPKPNSTETFITATNEVTLTETEHDTTETWPKQKQVDKKLEEGEREKMERKPTVEAQRHDGKVKQTSNAPSTVVNFKTIIFELFIVACLI